MYVIISTKTTRLARQTFIDRYLEFTDGNGVACAANATINNTIKIEIYGKRDVS